MNVPYLEPKKGWECDVCGGQSFNDKGECKFCLEKEAKE